MRRTRRVFVLGIFSILCVVGGTYYVQKSLQQSQAPPTPQALPLHVNAAGRDWCYSEHDGQRPVVEVCAKSMEQVKEPSQFDLRQVELRIFHKDGKEYDRVRSARAAFDIAEGILFAEGAVEIAMAVPAEGPPRERLLVIRSSGVKFESKTGRASTKRPASFAFDRGDGQAVGASYDPATRELHMHSQVELRWRSEGAGGKLMKVEAGTLVYKEVESKVYLSGWSRLTRGTMTLAADDAVVTLEEGAIRVVEAENARGSDRYPARQLDYQAEHLVMRFAAKGEMEQIVGERRAKLVSATAAARTTITTDRIHLDFEAASGDSLLRKAVAYGKSSVESAPVARDGAALPETRILRSDVIETQMRSGGKEIERIETHTPGTVEFLPNRPGQRQRRMDGERMWIYYGSENRIRSFRAVEVKTSTNREPKKDGKPQPPALTWSGDLAAEFDPETSQMTSLEQWREFRYEEGGRKAVADRAVLESRTKLIRLRGRARVWDSTGSTAGELMVLDQDSNDFTAEGLVSSTRLPDDRKAATGLLSGEEPVHATAAKMISTENNTKIVYEGGATLWQGTNRLQAQKIEIDRKRQRLDAEGGVISRFADKADGGGGQARKKTAPVFTSIEAPELVYTEVNRTAHYRRGVMLERKAMRVKAEEIRAFLKQDAESGLDYAFADGQVEIVQKAADRTRTGTGEHGEYFVAEEKVVLQGGRPKLVDTLRGTTQGKELTYFAGNDRLLVDGAETQPTVSRLQRK